MARVGAVILAAGGSSRFGRSKQLIQFRGRTLIEAIIKAATESNCDPVIVVTGSDSAKIATGSKTQGVALSFVENTRWRDGIGSSIRTGVQHLIDAVPNADAAVLLVCDQPFVTGRIIADLVEHWTATGKQIVASKYADTLGVPALFDRSCFDELLRLENASGAKPIIFKNADRVDSIDFDEGKVDIDTPGDFSRIDHSD